MRSYHIARKFGKFGKSYMICQLKPSKLVLTTNNLLADQLIYQTFFCQMLEKSQFAKLSICQNFPLCGIFCYTSSILLLFNFNLVSCYNYVLYLKHLFIYNFCINIPKEEPTSHVWLLIVS